MRRIVLVAALLALALAVPVSARTTASHPCPGTSFKLRVQGISCRAGKKAVTHGSRGYTCKEVGHPKQPPFTLRCRRNKNHRQYYQYQTNGG